MLGGSGVHVGGSSIGTCIEEPPKLVLVVFEAPILDQSVRDLEADAEGFCSQLRLFS